MQIINQTIFTKELDNITRLEEASGTINERIINFVDRTRDLEACINFLCNIFKDFSLDIDASDKDKFKQYFSKNEINYFTLKHYICLKINELY